MHRKEGPNLMELGGRDMKRYLSRFVLLCFAVVFGFAAVAGGQAASAAGYPERPIQVVVPYSPGGGTHLSAEILVPNAEDFLGQPIQIITKPGAGGAVGATFVSKSKPDGYTLLYTTLSLAIAPHLNPVGYEIGDFVGIAQCTAIKPVLAVKADSPWNNAKELVEWVNENPRELSWCHPGVGSSLHLLGANAMHAMGIADKVKEIPFKGTAKGVASVLGGHVDVISTFAPAIMENVKAGEMKILGVSGETRITYLPDVPTFKEQGYDATLSSWRGVFAPKGTSPEIIAYLNDHFAELVGSPEYAKRAEELGEPMEYKDSEAFTKMLHEQYEMIGKIVEKLGLGQ